MSGMILQCEKCHPTRNRVHEPIKKLMHAEEKAAVKKFALSCVKLNQKCKPPRRCASKYYNIDHFEKKRYQKWRTKSKIVIFWVRSKKWFTPPETFFKLLDIFEVSVRQLSNC